MIIGKFEKQPGERDYFTRDYTDDLDIGDYILSATAVSSAPAVMPITLEAVVNPFVTFWKEIGGVSGFDYKVTIKATTFIGRIIEDEVIIKVREI